MKVLLLLVSVIAVLTVDSRDFYNGPQNLHSTDQLQQEEDTSVDGGADGDFSNEPQEFDSTDKLQQGEETSVDGGSDSTESSDLNTQERKNQHEMEPRRSKCIARNACVVVGGFCVTNATLCSGRLVDEGCKGRDCQCCINDPVNTCMANSNSTLLAIKTTFNSGNDNLTRDIELKIQTMEMDLKKKLDDMTKTLDHIVKNQASQGCPIGSGFFTTDGSNQSFKFYYDVKRNWTEASAHCVSEGLVLAQTTNPVAVRSHIVNTYGPSSPLYTWIGGKSDGSYVKWEIGNAIIPQSGPNWWYYNASSGQCLMLMTSEYWMNREPTKPYHSISCTASYWTLCEVSKN